jgi:hypothetical protein
VANTLVKISTVTVGSGGAATIDFTSIPQTYTDLKLVLSGRIARTGQNADDVLLSFNTLTTNFTNIYVYGNGATVLSGTTPVRYGGILPATTATASVFGNTEIYIPNYTSANNKSFSVDSVSENNATTAYQILIAGLWSNVAAITGITLTPANGTGFDQYSSASLYGIIKT